jgi:hypothetical protein
LSRDRANSCPSGSWCRRIEPAHFHVTFACTDVNG